MRWFTHLSNGRKLAIAFTLLKIGRASCRERVLRLV